MWIRAALFATVGPTVRNHLQGFQFRPLFPPCQNLTSQTTGSKVARIRAKAVGIVAINREFMSVGGQQSQKTLNIFFSLSLSRSLPLSLSLSGKGDFGGEADIGALGC